MSKKMCILLMVVLAGVSLLSLITAVPQIWITGTVEGSVALLVFIMTISILVSLALLLKYLTGDYETDGTKPNLENSADQAPSISEEARAYCEELKEYARKKGIALPDSHGCCPIRSCILGTMNFIKESGFPNHPLPPESLRKYLGM